MYAIRSYYAIARACADQNFPAEVACLISDNPDSGAVVTASEFGIPWHPVEPGERRGRLAPGEEERIVTLCREAGVV